jgi:mannosyltransferase OCH1-like enzyme
MEQELPVPRRIHQTYKDQNVPPEWRFAQGMCQTFHPGWEYHLWTGQ